MKKGQSVVERYLCKARGEREDSKNYYSPSRRVAVEDKCEFRYGVQSPMKKKKEMQSASGEYHEYK